MENLNFKRTNPANGVTPGDHLKETIMSKVTIETMKKWLTLVYAETDATGSCAPSKYKVSGGSNIGVAAKNLGIIEKHGLSSRWVDLSNPPDDALANELFIEYTAYRNQCEVNAGVKAGKLPGLNPDQLEPNLPSLGTIMDQLTKIEAKIDSVLARKTRRML